MLLTACVNAQVSRCSAGWKVTGYYTPDEAEYSGVEISVTVSQHGEAIFKKDFLRAVKMEGWGKSRHGWYLGFYAGRWHKSNYPLNALGEPLKLGTVAVDSRLVDLTSTVRLPALQNVTGIRDYSARDRGQAIKRRHIDIYTGEGKAAKHLAWEVTGIHEVCISKA